VMCGFGNTCGSNISSTLQYCNWMYINCLNGDVTGVSLGKCDVWKGMLTNVPGLAHCPLQSSQQR
jgi:hypothetical protein